VQGRWSLAGSVFGGEPDPAQAVGTAPRLGRAAARALLGIVTREQVLAEGIKGGFAMLYDTFAQLETLGICRRGYFIEGMGGAQCSRFREPSSACVPGPASTALESDRPQHSLLAATDPAQPYGAALPWPKREGLERRPARVAGAYVVSVREQPVALRRAGRARARHVDRRRRSPRRGQPDLLDEALRALADAVRSGRVGKLSLERIDGEPAIGSTYVGALIELGFQSGPRRLTLSA